MSRLHEVLEKLSAAINRLEEAAAHAPSASAASAEHDTRVAELERELDRVQRDHMALEATVDQVASRLDAVIARLKTSVEG